MNMISKSNWIEGCYGDFLNTDNLVRIDTEVFFGDVVMSLDEAITKLKEKDVVFVKLYAVDLTNKRTVIFGLASVLNNALDEARKYARKCLGIYYDS